MKACPKCHQRKQGYYYKDRGAYIHYVGLWGEEPFDATVGHNASSPPPKFALCNVCRARVPLKEAKGHGTTPEPDDA